MLLLFLFLLFALFPLQSTAGAKAGLLLCGNSVIASLFPFMVISRMIIHAGSLPPESRLLQRIATFFHISPGGVPALLLGMLCGYPMGSKIAADLCAQQQISRQEASFLLSFCNHCGPAFAIAAVGSSFFGSPKAGVMLFVAHILAGVLTGRTLCLFHRAEKLRFSGSPKKTASFSVLLTDAVKDSCLSMINVVGIVVLFSAFFAVLKEIRLIAICSSLFGPHADGAEAVLFGLFEITSGLKLLSSLSLPYTAKLCLAEGILSFGGLSVFFQTLSFVAPLHIKTAPYLIGKVLSSLLSVGLIFLWLTAGLPVLLMTAAGYLLVVSAVEKPCKAVQIYCKRRPKHIGQKQPEGKRIQPPIADRKKNYQI